MGKTNYRIPTFSDQYYIESISIASLSRVYFTFGTDGISENPGAPSWTTEDIVGSTSPIRTYINNGARAVSFTHQFSDDYTTEPLTDIRDKLSALQYPLYNGGIVVPNLVRMRLGNIYIRGIVTSMNFDWSGPIRNGNHILLKVSLTVEEVRDESFDASSVYSGLWNGA